MNQQYWRDFWDKHISEADNNYRATGRGSSPEIEFFWTVHHVATTLELKNGDALMDIGCGTGIMSLLLSPFVQFIDAYDLSPKAVELSRVNVDGTKNVFVRNGSITQIPIGSDLYDKVIGYSVLQYLDNILEVREALLEVKRVLITGGKALLAANPDTNKMGDYVARVPNYGIMDKILWLKPSQILAMALFDVGFKSADIIPIPSRIWQSFYMFDLLVEK